MILVTGASGLLGANLVFTAAARKLDVVGVSRNYYCDLPGIRRAKIQLLQRDEVKQLFRSVEPQWVVHSAAATNVDWCQAHPEQAAQINTEVPRMLAAEARAVGSGFVYISTDSVFDGRVGSYSEEDPTGPLNEYARSKLAGEKAVRDELNDSLIIRTNFYGWNLQEKQSLAEWMLACLEANERMIGFEDVVFSPLLVNQLCETILEMLARKLEGLYHLASADACNKYEFAVRIARAFDLNESLITAATVAGGDLSAPRPKNTSLKTNKIRQAIGRSMPGVETGLAQFKGLLEAGYTQELKQCRREW